MKLSSYLTSFSTEPKHVLPFDTGNWPMKTNRPRKHERALPSVHFNICGMTGHVAAHGTAEGDIQVHMPRFYIASPWLQSSSEVSTLTTFIRGRHTTDLDLDMQYSSAPSHECE
jgi:hypothetical protein